MKYYCFNNATVVLTTYGKYNKETDTHEELYFRVPQDWLMEYIQKEELGYESISDFCNNYTWDTSLSTHERAMTEGMLLPVNETNGCCYHLKTENEELAQQLYKWGHWIDGRDDSENGKYAAFPWLEFQSTEEEGYIQAYAKRTLPEFIKLYKEVNNNGR